MLEKHEGRGFAKEENRIAFDQEIDRFLRTAVSGRSGDVKLAPLEVIALPAKPAGDN